MASSSFMNKQTVISGVAFATNNFVAVLDHQDLPSEFHIIHDFLTSSQLKYALTEPASVSFKSVMQVWNSVSFDKGHSGSILMSFEYDGVTHYVTPAIVEEALHLPILGDAVPDNVSDSTLFEFVTKLGYNGEVKIYGNLFRTKLKKEYNYFFDTISRCFLNKTSNFDALPPGSLKIGYSLIYSTVFDYGSFILKALSDRKSDKLVIGNAFIPDEVRLFLKEKMPTYYGSLSDAMGQGQTHLVPDTSIPPKQSKQSSATFIVPQKTLVVKTKKSTRSDVSGRQSGSKDFSSTPLTKKKKQRGVQGVLVQKDAKTVLDKGVEDVPVKRRLILRDESDSEDDMPISSKFKIIKEVADTAIVVSTKSQKKRKLSKSRYHIPLPVQMKDTDIQTSNPDESSIPDVQPNPDVGIPDAQSKIVFISDSPAKASPTAKIVEISWEKVAETASKLGFSHPMEKKRKAEDIVFQRQKKLKGSSPQEPESQCDSTAIDDPAPQEPLNQSLGEGMAIGMVPQEPFSQRENEDINIPATQEPSSKSEDAGKATASEEFTDNAQGISGENERLVEDTVTEGSTQEPLTQSVKAASEPHATQEPSVSNPDASLSNPDGVAPNASGAPDAEPILIQPLSSRPMIDSITASQDKLKGFAIPDPYVTHDFDADDSDDDNNEEKDQLDTTIKASLGTNFGSSSTFMAGKATTGKDLRQDFSVPSEMTPAEALRQYEWNNSWYRSSESVSFPYALDHAYDAVKLIENQDLKNHLKATTLLSKGLKHEIDSVKAATELVRTDISQNFTKVPTALQLRIVESQVKSVITEQTSINSRIDSLDSKVADIQTSLALILNLLSNSDVKKGEKVSSTKCTPDLVLRNNDEDTGNDGGDKVLQGETSDTAVMKTIQSSQSQTTQSTHVSDSGIRTVKTLVQSQILTEEQILTGDQILMTDQILTPGHGQTVRSRSIVEGGVEYDTH
ncbi:hypothetical protein POM88_045385 [Heracleum sosnowskyi]|uniref:Uncharacterized protein n=1 Tax=Heracleum sosnowskyi TaxID=360622 RepID=A0AAD8H6V9_9APIA|nr:hypothetical protein POM88_045385 [Heracleum sosnowskyi]